MGVRLNADELIIVEKLDAKGTEALFHRLKMERGGIRKILEHCYASIKDGESCQINPKVSTHSIYGNIKTLRKEEKRWRDISIYRERDKKTGLIKMWFVKKYAK